MDEFQNGTHPMRSMRSTTLVPYSCTLISQGFTTFITNTSKCWPRDNLSYGTLTDDKVPPEHKTMINDSVDWPCFYIPILQ